MSTGNDAYLKAPFGIASIMCSSIMLLRKTHTLLPTAMKIRIVSLVARYRFELDPQSGYW